MTQGDKHFNLIEDLIEIDNADFSVLDVEKIALDDKLFERYLMRYGARIYSVLLKSVTHESFADDEAKDLWMKIAAHWGDLNLKLERNVGLPVACLDYLTNLRGLLSRPKIISEAKSKIVLKNSLIDGLTALYKREVFDLLLDKQCEQYSRKSQVFSLLMIDLDDFKQINDQYGHLKGDKILRAVGRAVKSVIRDMDFAARYGGEELAIILPETEIKQAFALGERLREKVEQLEFKVTVSIGICAVGKRADTGDKLVQNADEALYQAKRNGKNQVVASAA